jgi:hypothetical protein
MGSYSILSVYPKIGVMTISKVCIALVLVSPLWLSSCSVNKLEARLEADPQCRPVFNAKTGALMPCPGSDKDFYRSVGLMAPASTPKANPVDGETANTESASSSATKVLSPQSTAAQSISPTVKCKPQLHQKTGSLMPCPAP